MGDMAQDVFDLIKYTIFYASSGLPTQYDRVSISLCINETMIAKNIDFLRTKSVI